MPFVSARPLGFMLLAFLGASASGVQPATAPAAPQRGATGDADGDPIYEFETRPDSAVLIRSSRGDSLRIEPDYLRRIAGAYGGALTGDHADVRRGYDVEDGSLTVYYARRISMPMALTALGVLVALAASFAVWALRRIARDTRRKAQLQTYRATLAEGRERERLRLAREIHDGPLQGLHALRLQLAAADEADLEADLLATIRELRRVVEGLRPPALDRYSLADAVDALVRRFEEDHPEVHVEAHVEADPGAIAAYDDVLRLTLYRLAQESLHNVGEHAEAGCVRLQFDAGARHYELTVEDDGVGFDPDAAPDDGHFGLVGMAERAEAVAAELDVVSRPGAGTRLRLAGVPTVP